MTDHAVAAPGVDAGRGRSHRLRWIIAGFLAVMLAAGALWLTGRLGGTSFQQGPLEGTNFENIRTRTKTTQQGVLWGSLLLHNGTDADVVLDEVTLADNPQHVVPSAGPYVWDMDRVDLLQNGAVSASQLPLPSDWKIPPKHSVKGFRIPPQTEEQSVEVIYEFPLPTQITEINGITVRYRTKGVTYRKTYDVSIIMCPQSQSDNQRCHIS